MLPAEAVIWHAISDLSCSSPPSSPRHYSRQKRYRIKRLFVKTQSRLPAYRELVRFYAPQIASFLAERVLACHSEMKNPLIVLGWQFRWHVIVTQPFAGTPFFAGQCSRSPWVIHQEHRSCTCSLRVLSASRPLWTCEGLAGSEKCSSILTGQDSTWLP